MRIQMISYKNWRTAKYTNKKIEKKTLCRAQVESEGCDENCQTKTVRSSVRFHPVNLYNGFKNT